ncbi:MAG: vitamin K epoxide reductase family protein [Actinomycetota bacterium]
MHGDGQDLMNAAKVSYPVFLIVSGLLGVVATFALLIDSLTLLSDPSAELSCTVSASLQCGTNIESWQGRVLGFPNPALGILLFPAPTFVGVAMIAGARFAAWFWFVFVTGLWGAVVFTFWLAFQSVFVLGTLCPWCALVYVVVIPLWVISSVRLVALGHFGVSAARRASALLWWAPLISVGFLVAIFGTAQWRLDILGSLS